MLVPMGSMGYQCFVVNYRISPYTMQESATDLQRAIRYIRAHADDYGIDPEDIALVGFSAGGILNGEVLLHWRNLANASTLVPDYEPDELDQIPVDACAIGMIYAFYGRLSVSMNDVETLREADLPPAFYCWGENDGFAGQFTQNAQAVREAGYETEVHVLQGYPHGFGTGDSPSVWGEDFDAFLAISCRKMTERTTRPPTKARSEAENRTGSKVFPNFSTSKAAKSKNRTTCLTEFTSCAMRTGPARFGVELDCLVSAWLEPKSVIRLAGAFPMAEMVLSGILPASVRILLLATPRRSPLRLRLGEKHATWHKRAISPKSDDRFGLNCVRLCARLALSLLLRSEDWLHRCPCASTVLEQVRDGIRLNRGSGCASAKTVQVESHSRTCSEMAETQPVFDGIKSSANRMQRQSKLWLC